MKITREDRKHLKKTLAGMTKRKTKKAIFYHLCFCLCAPQTTFKSNIKVIEDLKRFNLYGRKDVSYSKLYNEYYIPKLRALLRPVRFYNNKAKYLLEAKKKFPQVLNLIWKEHGDYCYLNKDCGYDKREWLVKNIKGMGMKAASHFLRNLGYDALAIIDTHIIRFLAKHSTAGWQNYSTNEECLRKQATKISGYEDLEMWFQTIAGHMNLTTAELDALIWKKYSNTSWEDFKY